MKVIGKIAIIIGVVAVSAAGIFTWKKQKRLKAR